MKTTPKALKGLYTALGGSSPIADESKTVDVLNAISQKIGGDGGATKIPDAIDNIAAKADDLVIPTGKLSITGTAEVDCSAYAKAQVSSATLLAENIKKDVSILGVTGSYEGGGGSSDFSTATVTLVRSGDPTTKDISIVPIDADSGNDATISFDDYFESTFEVPVPGSFSVIYTDEYCQLWCGDLTGASVSGNGEFVDHTEGGETFKILKCYGNCTLTYA